MRFTKTIAAGLAVTVGALSVATSAEANHRWRHRYYHHHHHGGAAAAGVFGFAAGAIVGGALAQPRYYAPAPVYVAPPPVVYAPAPAPAAVYGSYPAWSPDWYASCESRYRSFNRETGQYLGYDGQYHFCL